MIQWNTAAEERGVGKGGAVSLCDAGDGDAALSVLTKLKILAGRGKQILYVLVVHFEVRHVRRELEVLLLIDALEQGSDSADHEPRVLHVSKHGVRLSRARCPIGENGRVETLQHAFH